MKFSIGDNIYVLVDNGNKKIKFKGIIVNETPTPFEYLVWVENTPATIETSRVQCNLIKLKSQYLELRKND